MMSFMMTRLAASVRALLAILRSTLVMEERGKAKPAREPLGSLPACLRAGTESPEARCQIRRRAPGEEFFTWCANQEEVV